MPVNVIETESGSLDINKNAKISGELTELQIYQETMELSLNQIIEQLKQRNVEFDESLDRTILARQLSKILKSEYDIDSENETSSNDVFKTTLASPLNIKKQRRVSIEFPTLIYFDMGTRRTSLNVNTSMVSHDNNLSSLDSTLESPSNEWLTEVDRLKVRSSGVNENRFNQLCIKINDDINNKVSDMKNKIKNEYHEYRSMKKDILYMQIDLYCTDINNSDIMKKMYIKQMNKQLSSKKKELLNELNQYINDQYEILKYKIKNVKKREFNSLNHELDIYINNNNKNNYTDDPFYNQLMQSNELNDETKDNIYKSLCLYRWKLEKEYQNKLERFKSL